MFYEDFEVGRETETGSKLFTRESILAYAERYDPRVLALERQGGESLLQVCMSPARRCGASWIGMQPFAPRPPHGAISSRCWACLRLPRPRLPSSGESRGHHHFLDAHDLDARDLEAALRAGRQRLWGVNQRGEETLSFSSLVFAVRRSGEDSRA